MSPKRKKVKGKGIRKKPTHTTEIEIKSESEQSREEEGGSKNIVYLSSGSPGEGDIGASSLSGRLRRQPKLEIKDEALTIDESSEGERKQSVDLPSTSQPLPKKIKVYEMAPYEDPDKEKRRLNAIMARKNREIKKREIQGLKKENQSLRHVIAQCNKVLRKTNSDVQQLRLELKKSKKFKLQFEETVKSKNRELRDAHDKLVLYRGHIELIACSLEEDNPAKKLIEALLKRMPASRSFTDDTTAGVGASTSSVDPVKVKESVE
ncbi:uncharacterized protein LOC121874217 [Homarus americanus]|uniref:BZIP domain-containing protein n=1 Tax=Homarus americanus TaxID=6706 RepID=A0A8J5MS64_HOMAM|nr:uncharacterized protein LOC121874217 [Homarus americanus]KAG7162170.1 hypothetical protein Hamer_G010837 [Homarus americanus]